MSGEAIAIALLTLGAIFVAGLAADVAARRTRLPRVTLLLVLGVAVGPIGLDLFPDSQRDWFPFVADLALLMVAFLLGGELTAGMLRRHGREVLGVSLLVVATTAVSVAFGLIAAGFPQAAALLLGAIATSTDPVAVSDVIREVRAKGPFARTLLGVVAVDDAWGIVVMSVALAAVLGVHDGAAAWASLGHGAVELTGALLLGAALGVPMALLSGRVRDGEPTLAEALGGVLLCGGFALWLGVSFLLAAMAMGVVVANLARHHRRTFRAIEGIEWPFMILFFVLSGAALRRTDLEQAGAVTLAYIALRVFGRIAGGLLSARILGARDAAPIGLAMLPQAGIAIGMALVASQRVPHVGDLILSATVAATIIFEIAGPLVTRAVLLRTDREERLDTETG